jgi:hypothetical protein
MAPMRGPARGVRVVIEVDGARPRGRGAVRRGHHDDDQRRVRHGRGRGRGVVTAACTAPDQQYTRLLYEVLGVPIGYADLTRRPTEMALVSCRLPTHPLLPPQYRDRAWPLGMPTKESLGTRRPL